MRYAIALSAVLTALALSAPANAQSVQTGKFCLSGGKEAGASMNCSFQTMAACDKAKSGTTEKCMPNTGTTGQGSGMMKDQKKN